MGTFKNYSYLVYTDISRAMNQYNRTITGSRLNIIDANILSIVKSFSESGTAGTWGWPDTRWRGS